MQESAIVKPLDAWRLEIHKSYGECLPQFNYSVGSILRSSGRLAGAGIDTDRSCSRKS